MSNILLAYSNRADAATLAGGSWNGTLVLNNLKDDDLSLVSRSADAKPSSTRFRFDLGDEYTLRTLALVNHTFSSSATWRVRMGRSPFDVDLTAEVLDERVTASGGVNGTVVNSRGRIVKVTRTNYAVRSQEFDNASWTKTNATVTANATTASDGTTTADKLLESAAAGEHHVSQSVTLAAGAHTLSVEVAGGLSRSWCFLQLGSSASAYFNVDTGEVGTVASVDHYHAEQTAAGFWRFSITAVLAAGAHTVYVGSAETGSSKSFTGSTSKGLYLWAAQVEDNSDSTDYIPTTTATVTATISGGRRTHDPENLASGVTTQTVANVPAGVYALVVDGAGASVVASGTVVKDGTSATAAAGIPTQLEVTATGSVTLTVTGTATALHLRQVLGRLVEEARENVALYSEQFDNASWTKSNSSVTANAATAPDGTLSADKLVPSTANSQHFTTGTGSVADGVTGTFSVYAKAAGYSLLYYAASGSTSFTATWNLLTGEAVGVGGTASMEAVGDGWYRCIFTCMTALGTYVNAPYLLPNSYGAFAGDGTSGVYVWGAQLEVGAFATSYIPTTSAAVTRTADSLKATGANFTSWYTQGAGTLYADFTGPASGPRIAASLDDTTTAEELAIYTSNAQACLYGTDGAIVQADFATANAVASGVASKLAAAYAVNDFALCLDGGAVATDSAGTLSTPTQLQIGADPSGQQLCGTIARVTYWPERLTNSELQSITTSGPDAIGYDSGWVDVQQMTFRGDTPSDWGSKYAAMVATSADVTARYGTVEIDDSTNENARVDIGRLFVGGGLQPAYNASREGFADGRDELSSVVTSPAGKRFGTERRRPRHTKFALRYLTDEEGQRIHEMQDEIGTLDEVMYLPDPADMAKSQRFGFLGHLRTLGALEYPIPLTNSVGFEIAEKL